MGKSAIYLCSFSGPAAELKRGSRTEESILTALKEYPCVNTWDMSEKPWLRNIITKLEKKKLINQEPESYPWHRWSLTDAGENLIKQK